MVHRLPWRSHARLPHIDHPGLIQAITFRQADSLPAELVVQWRQLQSIARRPAQRAAAGKLSRRIEEAADAGHGSCVLRDSGAAQEVERTLRQADGTAYHLLEWCVMPNHVHALIETVTGHPVSKVVQAWKSVSSHRINQRLGRKGPLWLRDYFDRFIRDDAHFAAAVQYIRENPVRAGLIESAERWPWSSARARAEGG